MSSYLLIESRDPYESADTVHISELAASLRRAGNDVSVLLINNGVLPARRDSEGAHLNALLQSNVNVLADDFSLRERAIDLAALKQGIEAVAIDYVIDKLIGGAKVIWH
ncbi:MAG TPA: DsrE family protein [Gammaproteobacteria bacterium]